MRRLHGAIRTLLDRKKPRPEANCLAHLSDLEYNPNRPTTGPADQQLQDMLRRVEGNTEIDG